MCAPPAASQQSKALIHQHKPLFLKQEKRIWYLFIQKYVTKKRLAAKGEPATESRLPVGGGRTKKIIRKKKKDTYTETKQY
jgi:hypothetical protein